MVIGTVFTQEIYNFEMINNIKDYDDMFIHRNALKNRYPLSLVMRKCEVESFNIEIKHSLSG